jgi:DNA-binding Xre family transcriptional regulator
MIRLKLKELAEARGLNLNQTALRSQISLNVIRRYWYSSSTGRQGGPPLTEVRLDFLERLADLLECDVTDLLQRTK